MTKQIKMSQQEYSRQRNQPKPVCLQMKHRRSIEELKKASVVGAQRMQGEWGGGGAVMTHGGTFGKILVSVLRAIESYHNPFDCGRDDTVRLVFQEKYGVQMREVGKDVQSHLKTSIIGQPREGRKDYHDGSGFGDKTKTLTELGDG